MNWHEWVIILVLSLLWLIVLLQGIVAIVSIARADEENEPVETVRYWVTCHPSSEVNVRERATTDSGIIGRLRPGDQVEVYAVGGGWACTDAGYIQSKYLCEVEMEEAGLCPVQIAAHGN